MSDNARKRVFVNVGESQPNGHVNQVSAGRFLGQIDLIWTMTGLGQVEADAVVR